MTLRRPIRILFPAVPLLGCLVVGSCASGHGASTQYSDRLRGPEGQVVTEEAIAKSGARTAWEALRFTVHNINFYETGRGQPTAITRRGRSSMVLDDGPRILVDGVALTDYTVLARMPASDLLSIEVLSPMDATTLYGTNYVGGVIRIHTRTGS